MEKEERDYTRHTQRDYPMSFKNRGIQSCSDAYQRLLRRYGIKTSMTESYDPYANAVAERINGILKQEFLLEERNLPFKLVRKVISECVYVYNNLRPHLSCGYNTPEWMHSQRNVAIKTYKRKPPQEIPVAVSLNLLLLPCKTCNGYLGLVKQIYKRFVSLNIT